VLEVRDIATYLKNAAFLLPKQIKWISWDVALLAPQLNYR
jgi:hypothetical protein